MHSHSTSAASASSQAWGGRAGGGVGKRGGWARGASGHGGSVGPRAPVQTCCWHAAYAPLFPPSNRSRVHRLLTHLHSPSQLLGRQHVIPEDPPRHAWVGGHRRQQPRRLERVTAAHKHPLLSPPPLCRRSRGLQARTVCVCGMGGWGWGGWCVWGGGWGWGVGGGGWGGGGGGAGPAVAGQGRAGQTVSAAAAGGPPQGDRSQQLVGRNGELLLHAAAGQGWPACAQRLKSSSFSIRTPKQQHPPVMQHEQQHPPSRVSTNVGESFAACGPTTTAITPCSWSLHAWHGRQQAAL